MKQGNSSLIVGVRTKSSLALWAKYIGGTSLPKLHAMRQRAKEKENQVHCTHNAKGPDPQISKEEAHFLAFRVLNRDLLLTPF